MIHGNHGMGLSTAKGGLNLNDRIAALACYTSFYYVD